MVNIIKSLCVHQKNIVFDKKTDALLFRLGREARKKLEMVPLNQRKKILYFLGYHHAKFLALNDATTILALQLRGAEVVPVLSGMFYQNEDVIFGGVFNQDRLNRQLDYAHAEAALTSALLCANPVSVSAFESPEAELQAEALMAVSTFESRMLLSYRGMAVGEMAEKLVCNMNNCPAMLNIEEHLRQYKWHVYNIVRLIGALSSLIDVVSPHAIVSNFPFYYRWRVPFEVAKSKCIPFYSYVLGERKNTLAWAMGSAKIFDVSPCWDSYSRSDTYSRYSSVVEDGINDRIQGNISHIPFAPKKNDSDTKVLQIVSAIEGRPAVLFPVNVLVDAAVLIPTKAFSSCMCMVAAVVEYFREHPKYVCLLKAHPAESIWKNMGVDVLSMHLKQVLSDSGIPLPDNVIFIDYDENVSSFSLYPLVQGLIAYSSSTCMEMSWFGKQVITAHDAHYTCADFAKVPQSSHDFFRMLDGILTQSSGECGDAEIRRLGKSYYLLHHYICQMDNGLVEGNDLETVPPKLRYNSIDSLMPGRNEALDFVCESILTGAPIYGENRWPPVTAHSSK